MGMTTYCGYIGIVGRPNAGKSTLLNALVGQKIVGVSAKPQTTRNKILGILTLGDTQLLFLDTPGMHRNQNRLKLNSMLNREAWSVLGDANLLVYLLDVSSVLHDEDLDYLKTMLEKADAPVQVALSKTDTVKKHQVQEVAEAVELQLEKLASTLTDPASRQRLLSTRPLLLSAKQKETLSPLLDLAQEQMPEGEWLYPSDDLTNRSQKFICQELIREQLFRLLGDELPYQCAVRMDAFEVQGALTKIMASIVLARDNHKGMVLGKQGQKIKEIGTAARESLEQHLGTKVYLDLQVIVDPDWINSEQRAMAYLGLDVDGIE